MEDQKTSFPLFQAISGVALAAGILWLYWPILVSLVVQLAGDEDFSFGLLLPLVSAYIVYEKWPQIRSRKWHPSWSGLAVVLLGLGLYIAGKLGTGRYLTRFSFLVFVAGIIFQLGGWRLLYLLSFPLSLLLLMLPPPITFISDLTLPLQLISSSLAAKLLRAAGIPVVLQGNILDLGDRQLQLVAACSGLRYILSMFALACIFCYFYQRKPWKIAVLLATIIPAAILANAQRVAAMGLIPALQQPGFWHDFSGWLIFVFCLVVLMFISRILDYIQPQRPVELVEDTAEAKENKSLTPYLIAALATVFLSVPIVHYGTRIHDVPLRQSFDNFPLQIGSWQGRHTYVDPEMARATGSHAQLSADFITPGQSPISLWIAYYQSQETEGIGHTPRNCLPGSGWNTIESGTLDVAPGLPVNYMVTEYAGERILVYFWNIVGGRWITNDKLNKFYLIYSGLRYRRTDAALVRLTTSIGPDAQASRKQLSNFARLLVPVLPQFFPIEPREVLGRDSER